MSSSLSLLQCELLQEVDQVALVALSGVHQECGGLGDHCATINQRFIVCNENPSNKIRQCGPQSCIAIQRK